MYLDITHKGDNLTYEGKKENSIIKWAGDLGLSYSKTVNTSGDTQPILS